MQKAYLQYAGQEKGLPVYSPTEFKTFCQNNGAPNLFDLVFACMTSPRHTKSRQILNQKRTVSLILQLCFGLSQKCALFQVDNGIFLRFSHCTNEGINTQRVLGTSCCSMTVDRSLENFATTNLANVNSALDDAIKNEQLLILMIDDYTTIHSKRRPKDLKTSKANSMCNIIFKIFPDIKAIPRPPPQFIHNREGINAAQLTNHICSPESMVKLSHTFASCFPELTTSFFDPLLERKRLESHDYCASAEVTSMRKFKNVYLVDFFEHPLKSKDNYMEALHRVLSLSKLEEYLSKFAVLFPGDHPSQFYLRRIIFELLKKYMTNIASSEPIYLEPLLSLIPMIGPLHIDLNADENLVLNYLPFLKTVYESLFPNRVLAEHPKPWRIQFILEIVYGGWTLIRRSVKAIFHKCKDVQYGTLLNFLDNYCPLVLSSYNILFKTNNFPKYYESIIRIWIMMYTLHRHHYRKSLLIWLSFIKFWEGNDFSQGIINIFKNHLNIVDESVIEYVHSIIRRHTTDGADGSKLRETMQAIFGCGARQGNFRSVFTPGKNYVFSRVQLKYLHTRVAKILLTFFTKISLSPGASHILPRVRGQSKDCSMHILPTLFGETPMKSYLLPFGFQTKQPPDTNKRCDYICTVTEEAAEWHIFEGCWHSFHKECLNDINYCPICSDHLKHVILSLSSSANSTFLCEDDIPEPDKEIPAVNEDAPESDDSEIDDLGINPSNEENFENLLNEINFSVMQLQPQSPSGPCSINQQSTTSVTCTPVTSAVLPEISTTNHPPRRPPHCLKCSHTRTGHGKGSSAIALIKCCMCPNDICSLNGIANICTCSWHLNQRSTSFNS